LDESGIYEYEISKSLKPKGFGPDYNSKVDIDAYQFAAINMSKMGGLFILYMFVKCICIIVIVLEYLTITSFYLRMKSFLNTRN